MEIKELFSVPGAKSIRVHIGDYITVKVRYTGGKLKPPLFWQVKEVDLDSKMIVYEIRKTDLEYYLQTNVE